MEDSHNSNASWNKNFNQSSFNPTDAYDDTENIYNEGSDLLFQFIDVVHWITICGGLPLILVALFVVSSMVKKDRVAPVNIVSVTGTRSRGTWASSKRNTG
ncbi:hypothetical protein ATANTOWER_026403 [Ataeniobius toweri]|uniref:Uncharacterized protein n=1 Tax=Ataeniobius toweri TaxID=208326 RepID=A0ABU7BS82_9TELE|nr:hypothetical protein [Ataeniobius toweri]